MYKWHKSLLEGYPKLLAWKAAMLENQGLADQVEKERDEPVLGNQDGYDVMAEQLKLGMMKNLCWGTPQKMEPMFE